MPYINQLTTDTSIDGSELVPVYDVSNSDNRKITLSALAAYAIGLITSSSSGYTTQYSGPSVSPASAIITDNGGDIHLILTPTGTIADMTINLPYQYNVDGQRFMVNTTQALTSLSLGTGTGSGITVVGAPGSMSANGYFTLKYDLPTKIWYRVG